MNDHQYKRTGKTKKMAGLAVFSAIIIVLQILCTFIRFGPFSITLALAPIIIGAAVYGPLSGAYLGFILGLIVLITGLFGWDGGVIQYLLSMHPLWTVLLCILKTTIAGLLAGLVYDAISQKSTLSGVITAGVVCPVVNTGLFILGMFLFFRSTLQAWAGGTNMMYYLIVSLTGINFIIELAINLILSSAITRIIKAGTSTPTY